MGLGGISLWQLLIVLVIIVLLFGTKKLRNIGSDLGGAVKGFKKAVTDGEEAAEQDKAKQLKQDDADFDAADKKAAEKVNDKDKTQ